MVLDKKQKILLISFFAAVLASGILLLWNFDIIKISTNSQTQINQENLESVDFSILNSAKLKELTGQDKDIQIGELGRDNPFAPF